MSDNCKRFLGANLPECEKCTFRFTNRVDGKESCFALAYHTDGKCAFFKTDERMKRELIKCYQNAENPFLRGFNDYCELLNISLQTTFYDKYKGGIGSAKK